ncbi:S8 family peptidase [Clostridium sulfidigenes]|uniref:S8 family peptidase n=1 Tax=Clostridium sulfidigenes TaxID=318464 RepID=UPI003F896C1A
MNTLSTSREIDLCREAYISEEYVTVFIKYTGDFNSLIKEIDYVCAFNVSEGAYIASVRTANYIDFINRFNNIFNIDISFPYTLSAIEPVEAANITQFHGETFLNLTGKGTIAAIIDTGIDYLNPQFQNPDGTTRIIGIWDQTIESNNNDDPVAFFGTVYSQDEINRAIQVSNQGGNPYDIVPSRDELGHGTNVAGLVGARGLNNVIGSAPECEFLIVKLKEFKTSNLRLVGINDRRSTPIFEGIDIYIAMRFVINYNPSPSTKPMSILISAGTNWGGHEGITSIEEDINFFSTRKGLIFVTNTGNQGASLTHGYGRFLKSNTIQILEIIVGSNENNLVLMLWVQRPDVISIELISPSGEIAKPIQSSLVSSKFEQVNLILENSIINIAFLNPEFASGNESIYITIKNPKAGLWQLRLKGDYIVNGVYNLWLPQRPLIQLTTRVINPNPYITLQAPANARKSITTSFYNQNNNTIAVESGRGFTADNRVKPNLTTGGVMALTTGLNNENTLLSGGSVAGAVLCGATLLLLEWGIVLGNDPNIYGPTAISYFTRGTSKRSGDIYPNPQWGYGILNLQGSFENLRSSPLIRPYDALNTQNENNLPSDFYIRTPKELYVRIDDSIDIIE